MIHTYGEPSDISGLSGKTRSDSVTGSSNSGGSTKARIFQQTESNICAMKALGEHLAVKAEETTDKDDNGFARDKEEQAPPKSLEECLKNITPLLASSRLLSTTQAAQNRSYRKSKEKEGNIKDHKVVKLLPTTSHLLAATTASKQYVYQPPPPPKPIVTPGSPEIDVSDRLVAFNACRKAAKYERKVVETDPREQGWNGMVTSSVNFDEACESPQGPGTGRSATPTSRVYRDIKSKLLAPTAASKRGQWAAGSPSEPIKTNPEVVTPPRSSSRGPHRNVTSRLHNPTAASQFGRYQAQGADANLVKRTPSPARSSTPQSSARRAGSPVVSGKTTAAQRNAQRTKYIPPQDEADIARARPSSAPSVRRREPKDNNCVVSEELSLDRMSFCAQLPEESNRSTTDEGEDVSGDSNDIGRNIEISILKNVIAELQRELSDAKQTIADQSHEIYQCVAALGQSETALTETTNLLQIHYRLLADKSIQLKDCEIARDRTETVLNETTNLLQSHYRLIADKSNQLRDCETALSHSETALNETTNMLQTHYRLIGNIATAENPVVME